VLQRLLEEDRPLSEIVAEQAYTIVKDKLPRDAGSLEAAFEVLEQRLGAPQADRQDGLRLDWPDERRWLHLRASGTEPILRIIAEAPSEEAARELVEQARALAQSEPARQASPPNALPRRGRSVEAYGRGRSQRQCAERNGFSCAEL
jgi:phosphomannomutase